MFKQEKKKYVALMMIMMILCCFSTTTHAKEMATTEKLSGFNATSSASAYNQVGVFSRNPSTIDLGRKNIESDTRIFLYMPKNGNKDLGQGKIFFSSLGKSKSFAFTNLSSEYRTINLATLSPGVYRVSIYAYVCGTSGQFKVSMKPF